MRDALLNRLGPVPDLDLVLPDDAIALCRQLQRRHGGSAVVLDAERSIARLVVQGWTLDLARQEGGSLPADLRRRDYTVNAMALPLSDPEQLVDPLGGLAHLEGGSLVAVAETNLLDDPLRLLRGLRLASELGFRLEPRTRAWIQSHAGSLGTVAGERVLAELGKLAAAPAGADGLAQALTAGLLQPWRAERSATDLELLESLKPARVAALELTAAEAAEALPLARLAALLDAAALQRLRSSRRLQQRVERLRAWRLQLGASTGAAEAAEQLADGDRLRLHRQLEGDLPALLLGWPTAAARPWLARWRQADDPLFHPRPAIDGASLQQALQLRPSPLLGELLDHLALEQAFGRLSGRDACLHSARDWLRGRVANDISEPRCD